ncbi:adenylate kinase 8 [Colias croceus]|uniref:adenylate kinase 8 n=1 Tax=Colias crocea TaxID=72248 RepID=UPI001E27A115|nr:adenylate kinase 8 [Colias croceus]
MTETDATRRPLQMPETFLPYLEKHRIYQLFKDMVRDLVIHLPKDHLKHMKVFVGRHLHSTKDVDRVIFLVSPELKIDINRLVREMLKDLGIIVISRRCVMDRYEKHDNYVPGCISPELMSEVTKTLTLKDPVPQSGWLMFDHPCTVREAQCLQQDGVLPTVTLVLTPPPPVAPTTVDPWTPARSFFQQDFEGLKFVYKSTLKEVYIEQDDDHEKCAMKCFNAIRACASGAQGPGQGVHASGAPGVYRVLLIGPRGSGRRTQAMAAAKQFDLVYLEFGLLFNEAKMKNDDIGKKLRSIGCSVQMRADIVRRRIAMKDCIDHGWILTGYPASGVDFELLDMMPTPPNRVIFLNVDWNTCKARATARGVDWCTGQEQPLGTGPRVLPRPADAEQLDAELDTFFTESLAELRAAAGITAVEVDGNDQIDQVQVRIQAAIMASPSFNIEYCSQLRNVCGD